MRNVKRWSAGIIGGGITILSIIGIITMIATHSVNITIKYICSILKPTMSRVRGPDLPILNDWASFF